MSSNGHHHGGDGITVLYKVVNSETDSGLYNAFRMPKTVGVTLATVKQHCVALNHLNHLGAEGFHWRVCIEDKQPASSSSSKATPFSWWDIQDENARLPVKDFGMSQVENMFMPKDASSSTNTATTDSSASKAAGALKGLGKAIAGAVDGSSSTDHGPRIPIIAFKLLDLVKMHDNFALKHGGSSRGHVPLSAPRPSKAVHSTPAHRGVPQSAPRHPPQQQRPPAQQQQQQRPQPPQQQQRPTEATLMDFGTPAPAPARAARTMHHSSSMPNPPSNETRAEKLKREYAQKNQSSNRVWDEIDQRWVEVGKGAVKAGSQSAPPQGAPTKSKVVGISLDPSNAVGKSASVQHAVHARVNEMRQSQQKAVAEIRERENAKKVADAEEDEVRRRLEPKIKAWSEEHGKKKQLRALLASLHTILWPGTSWKQLTIGDLLDDGKVKRAFFKASRVVHPDKTTELDAEKRFLAKRIFDALSQAKTEFDGP